MTNTVNYTHFSTSEQQRSEIYLANVTTQTQQNITFNIIEINLLLLIRHNAFSWVLEHLSTHGINVYASSHCHARSSTKHYCKNESHWVQHQLVVCQLWKKCDT